MASCSAPSDRSSSQRIRDSLNGEAMRQQEVHMRLRKRRQSHWQERSVVPAVRFKHRRDYRGRLVHRRRDNVTRQSERIVSPRIWTATDRADLREVGNQELRQSLSRRHFVRRLSPTGAHDENDERDPQARAGGGLNVCARAQTPESVHRWFCRLYPGCRQICHGVFLHRFPFAESTGSVQLGISRAMRAISSLI